MPDDYWPAADSDLKDPIHPFAGYRPEEFLEGLPDDGDPFSDRATSVTERPT